MNRNMKVKKVLSIIQWVSFSFFLVLWLAVGINFICGNYDIQTLVYVASFFAVCTFFCCFINVTMYAKCPACGGKLFGRSNYCPHCGVKLKEKQ